MKLPLHVLQRRVSHSAKMTKPACGRPGRM